MSKTLKVQTLTQALVDIRKELERRRFIDDGILENINTINNKFIKIKIKQMACKTSKKIKFLEDNAKELSSLTLSGTDLVRVRIIIGEILKFINDIEILFDPQVKSKVKFLESFNNYLTECAEDKIALDCSDFVFPAEMEYLQIALDMDSNFSRAVFRSIVEFINEQRSDCDVSFATFEENVLFTECNFGELKIDGAVCKKELHFYNTKAYGYTFRNVKIEEGLLFLESHSLNNKLHITEDSKIKKIEIMHRKDNFLEAENAISSIIIEDSEIKSLLEVDSTEKVNIDIKRTSGEFKIKTYTNNIGLAIEDTHGPLKIEISDAGDTEISLLDIKDSTVSNVKVEASHMERMLLRNTAVIGNFEIKSDNISRTSIDNCYIGGSCTIKEVSPRTKGDLEIQDTTISKEGKLLFSNSGVKEYTQILLSTFSNEGYFKLTNSKIDKLIIKDSVVGATELHIAEILSALLASSSIATVKFYSVTWCQMESITAGQEEFRQLKYAYEEAKNSIEAAKFYAKELSVYHQQFKDEAKTFKEREDNFMLTASELISNHGLSWARPLLWLMALITVGFGFSALLFSNETGKIILFTIFYMVLLFLSIWVNMILQSDERNIIEKNILLGMLVSFIFSVLAYITLDNIRIDAIMMFVNPFTTDFKDMIKEIGTVPDILKIIIFMAWVLYKTGFVLTSYHMIVALKRITKF